MNNIIMLFHIVFLLFCNAFSVHVQAEDELIKDCVITPQAWALDAPKNFSTTSDLRRQTGSSIFERGQSILIDGIVLDRDCIPLAGATIKIWQNNLGKKISQCDKEFYTGSSVSDNLGRFAFYTIMPLSDGDCEDIIHINIAHPDIIDFETVLLFSQSSNLDIISKLDKSEKDLLIAKCINCGDNNNILTYRFKVVVDGKISYRGY